MKKSKKTKNPKLKLRDLKPKKDAKGGCCSGTHYITSVSAMGGGGGGAGSGK